MTRIYSSDRYSSSDSFYSCTVQEYERIHLIFHASCFDTRVVRVDIDVRSVEGQMMCGMELISFINRVNRILTEGLTCDEASVLDFD